jgi:threonyl-tRNA synthetase
MSALAVRLPDGTALTVPTGSTVLTVAERIGSGLARAAVAGRIDGRLVDLRSPIAADVSLEIVTSRDAAAGEVIRHSAEHVMADAVKRLFPSVQIDVGRSDHSEKYQYDFKTERPFTPEDLARIEEEMGRIVAEKAPFEREVVDREAARALFASLGEDLKVSRLDDIPPDDAITIFRHGDFVDLCRGPHVQHAGQIGAFKLLEAAGAYWRGDESNPMLQRIYGTAFATKRELEEHLARIEEARRRDHRVIGRQLGLFFLSPAVGAGLAMWLPKGAILRRELGRFLEEQLLAGGYQPVLTPHIGHVDLYKKSGHYPYYADSQYPPIPSRDGEGESDQYLLKPMNCPHHIEIYAHEPRSYRDLPIRYAEFGTCYRFEKSGELNGLTRVRALTVDDAHIFCTPEQVEDEFRSTLELVQHVLGTFGFEDVKVSLSVRAPGSDKYAGDPARWDEAEATLQRVLESLDMNFEREEGEAAFYGPKVDFLVQDVIGRQWQLGTAQLDYVLPERFGLQYIGADNEPHQPVMIHRAPFGSFERFIGILIEHTGGDFPLWLAPVQVAILPITERHLDYGRKVQAALGGAGIRAELDERNEKLGFKIREAELQKVPVMAVVGDDETSRGTVTPRRRGRGKKGGEAIGLEAFVASLTEEIQRRGR